MSSCDELAPTFTRTGPLTRLTPSIEETELLKGVLPREHDDDQAASVADIFEVKNLNVQLGGRHGKHVQYTLNGTEPYSIMQTGRCFCMVRKVLLCNEKFYLKCEQLSVEEECADWFVHDEHTDRYDNVPAILSSKPKVYATVIGAGYIIINAS